jgi:RimJ/RimL family protein N-acetyltransferase
MLFGERVGLRARHEADGPILEAELYNDVVTQLQSDSRPWRPISPDSTASRYRIKDPKDGVEVFSVVELATQELAGAATLWGVDSHNRYGHLGIALRPACRGRQLGADVVRVLCHYGFAILGLHRLQIETLAENEAMIRAASKAGFVSEGLLRQAAWMAGEFTDEAIMGLLAEEWFRGERVQKPDSD